METSGTDSPALAVKPREWQIAALKIWAGRMSGVAEVVTGGGKTVFSLMCASVFREQHPYGRLAVVVPTLALLDQWVIEITESGLFANSEIGIHAGGVSPAASSALCHVMTMVAAREAAPRVAAEGATMIVVDECHRIASPSNSRALNADFAATLGLSATPEREYDELFHTEVAPILGEIFFKYTYADALESGVISRFRLRNIQVPLTTEEKDEYERLSRAIGVLIRRQKEISDFDERMKRLLQQRAAVSANAGYRVPAAVKVMDGYRGQRAIVFHERIESAEAIARELESRGHRVARYHSQIGAPLRRSELLLYRNGLVDVLVTCRALDEGLDVPNTEVAVIASSTASRRQRIQRVGRALRPKSDSALATVVTLFATRQERIRLEEDPQALGADSVEWGHVSVQ